MGRGRPRKPTNQLKLAGTYRADRHGREPQASGQPERQDLTGHAAWLWDFVVEELSANGTAKRLDTPLLFTLCQTWSLYRQALIEAAKAPTDKNARCAVVAYLGVFNSMAGKFGLSPSDRAKLSLPAAPPSSLEEFLNE